MNAKMKINIQKINNKRSFRYEVNVKVISSRGFILYLNLKNAFLSFSFTPTNSIYKDKTFWMNNDFNMYFTNKEDVKKFIYLMKYLEKRYKVNFKNYEKGLNSKKVFDKMFKDWMIRSTY